MQKLYSFIILLLVSSLAFGQSDNKKGGFITSDNSALTNTENPSDFTGQSGTGANIDVIYHKIFWRINPDSGSVATATKYIRGSVQTNFKTITFHDRMTNT